MYQATQRFAISLIALAALQAAPVHAASENDSAIQPYADIRYRLELVDQDGLPEDATASTIRIKLGVVTGEWQGFSAQVEGEAIARIGPRDFNDTVNGRTAFPVVADPSDVLLNQAIVKWQPVKELSASAGRQAVNLDNQRWVGSVGWRQNDQTLDAVRLTAAPVKEAKIDYVYAWRVNRVFGPDSPQGIWHNTDIHGLRASYAVEGIGTLTGYGYWLDIPAAPASSSQTLGVRIAGERKVGNGIRLLYTGEYARQTDNGPNPQAFGLDYWAGEAGIARGGFTAKVGLERLEGSGAAALQTPLATLHAFNGWADKFLVTPPNGLRDLYVDAGYKVAGASPLKGLTVRAIYHDFDSTRANISYGSEWNALIAYPLNKTLVLSAKFARYDAASFATDTTKAWFSAEVKF
ncbi:MAG: hypothetical protein CVT75_01180 [Alphaproteobacteria bacterium HGW-Alphaproteobacteria-14]|nr:MAG: hypothetical protein CVT75_01180 [Alphaproteobacteria bacterium HGW-Alphaproteobacteria-14]